MTVIVFTIPQYVDASTVLIVLNSLGIKTAGQVAEEKGLPPVNEGKSRRFRISGERIADVGPSEIVITSRRIRLEDFPENMTFGNGVTVSGNTVWIVVEPEDKPAVMAKLQDVVRELGAKEVV